MTCDKVTCELVLETARACRTLSDAMEEMNIEFTDTETQQRIAVRMDRMTFLFRLVPSVLDPRRLICLGDMAADRPEWWKANRLHFFDPELTQKQIAEFLHLNPHQVRDAIHKAEIPNNCYDNLPKLK